MVTDQQVLKYRNLVDQGRATREDAASRAGMSPNTARKWESGPMPTQLKMQRAPREWRTRKDHFAEHWEKLVLPELQDDEEGILEATFLFGYLQEIEPSVFEEDKLRIPRVADHTFR